MTESTIQKDIETLSDLERRLKVSVPKEYLEGKVLSKLKGLEPKVNLPGFRKGKVPFNIIKDRFEKGVREEVIADVIKETYFAAIEAEDLRPAYFPAINVMSEGKIGEILEFTATFEIFPEVNLVDFSQISLEREVGEVTEADVDWLIEKMRKQHAVWKEITDPAIIAQAGHKVAVNFDITINGEPPEVITNESLEAELGTKQVWHEFEDKLYGSKAGDELKFSLDFPETHLQKQFAGKKVDYVVRVTKLSSAEIPELNSEFVTKFGVESGDINDLRDNVRKFMENQLNRELDKKVNQLVLDKLCEMHKFELPKKLIEWEINKRKTSVINRFKEYSEQGDVKGLDNLFNADYFEAQVKKDLALGLIISQIIKDQKLEVDPHRMRVALQEIIDSGDTKQINELTQNKARVEEMKTALLEEDAINYVKQKINFAEKKVTYKDVYDIKLAE